MFLKVAQTYVHAKQEEDKLLQGANDISTSNGFNSWQPAIGELDDYLSVLGFAPLPSADQANGFPATSSVESGLSTHLQDWYSGNASLYGLLEQDLSNIGGFGSEQNQGWYS